MEQTAKKKRHFPIRFKTAIMVLSFGLVLVGIAMAYFSVVTSNENKSNYKSMATNLSNTVALSLDRVKTKSVRDQVVSYYEAADPKPSREQKGTPEYEAYLAQFDTVRASQDYIDLQKYLYAVKTANAETDGVYLAWVDYAAKTAVYLVYDTENEDFPVGVVDDLYEEDYPLIDNPKLGFVASIYVDQATGMTLVTAGAPVLDESGNVICYALVDITMDTVRAEQTSRIMRLFAYLIATVLLICVVAMVVVHFTLIKPVRTLRETAMSYDVDEPDKTHETFSRLELKVHDEFSDLAESMKAMENDVHEKINELTQANASLMATQKLAGKMAELANKDALTGVRNKIAFNNQVHGLNEKIANKEDIRFGLAMIDLNYLKTINDDFGHDSGDHALVKLCGVICDVFSHCPVYRVGGDEFVVLFKGRAYEEADQLITEFETRIDELRGEVDAPLEERISAAIGYSAFDPEKDTCVDDVFKRADKAMYARKREMKGQ